MSSTCCCCFFNFKNSGRKFCATCLVIQKTDKPEFAKFDWDCPYCVGVSLQRKWNSKKKKKEARAKRKKNWEEERAPNHCLFIDMQLQDLSHRARATTTNHYDARRIFVRIVFGMRRELEVENWADCRTHESKRACGDVRGGDGPYGATARRGACNFHAHPQKVCYFILSWIFLSLL